MMFTAIENRNELNFMECAHVVYFTPSMYILNERHFHDCFFTHLSILLIEHFVLKSNSKFYFKVHFQLLCFKTVYFKYISMCPSRTSLDINAVRNETLQCTLTIFQRPYFI